jgi:signal transduction histidine kinase/ActR/RegA family two-component response regulator
LEHHADLLRHELNRELKELERLTLAFAGGDGFIQAFQNHDTSFVQGVLTEDMFRSLQQELIFLIDRSGNVVGGRFYNLENGEFGELESFVRKRWNPLHVLLQHPESQLTQSGYWKTESGVFQVASTPVKSVLDSVSLGVIIMGRRINRSLVQNFEQKLGCEIHHKVPSDIHMSLVDSLKNINKGLLVRNLGGGALEGIFSLSDMNQKTVLLFTLQGGERIATVGKNTSTLSFLLVGMVLLVVFLGLGWILSHSVLKPLLSLTSYIHSKRLRKKTDIHLDIVRSDEVGDLNREFQSLQQNLELTLEQEKEARQNAYDLSRAAQAANRARSIFLSNMGHELRTPLNGIVGFAGLLAKPLADDERKEYSEILIDSCQELQQKLGDLLDWARIDSHRMTMHPREFQLKDLIAKLQKQFQHKAEQKGLSLDFWVDEEPGRMETDFDRLVQILENLISNAIKFTDEGGVRVEIRIKPTGRKDISSLNILVEDTGIGMQEEYRSTIFDPFTKDVVDDPNRYEGSGLGLAISHKLAELMDGDLSLEKSAPDKGSTFSLIVPVRIPYTMPEVLQQADEESIDATISSLPDDIAQKVFVSSSVSKSESKKEELKDHISILIVEDMELNHKVISTMLQKYPIEVFHAYDGKEGVAKCLKEKPDLILMDIQMPVMDGLTATAEIRKVEEEEGVAESAYIVALSGRATPEDSEEARLAGCDEVLPKPVHFSVLKELLKKFVNIPE